MRESAKVVSVSVREPNYTDGGINANQVINELPPNADFVLIHGETQGYAVGINKLILMQACADDRVECIGENLGPLWGWDSLKIQKCNGRLFIGSSHSGDEAPWEEASRHTREAGHFRFKDFIALTPDELENQKSKIIAALRLSRAFCAPKRDVHISAYLDVWCQSSERPPVERDQTDAQRPKGVIDLGVPL